MKISSVLIERVSRYRLGFEFTGDLPYDQGAEERIAQNQKRRNPFCMFLVGCHVVDEACPGHGGAWWKGMFQLA